MSEFENKIVCGQPLTRWIASWVSTAVRHKKDFELKYEFWKGFRKYLIEKGFTEQEAADCMFIATNGKLEIQDDMERYMTK